MHCIYSQSISCRRSLSLNYLVFLFDTKFYQRAWVWVICSDEISNQAKAKNLSNFTLLKVYLFVQFLHVRSISIYCHGYFFLVNIIWLAERKNKRKKKEPFFSNRELLSTRKNWSINPSLAQAHHRHYRHIAFISFQLKIATHFRKLSIK